MRPRQNLPDIAYFSMEIALHPDIPTYSGGLGILAGDTLRSGADLAVPIVGVTLLYRKGYFRQLLDPSGNQSEQPQDWEPEKVLESVESVVNVTVEGRLVNVRAWKFTVIGVRGDTIPVYLLDTNVPENSSEDRTITDSLYGGDARHRLMQELVLGIGGVTMLRALGYKLEGYHMNEGHSALLTLALLERRLDQRFGAHANEGDVEFVRRRCIFTTHTPVPAGHDKFPRLLVEQVLGAERCQLLDESHCWQNNELNMTYLALHFSRYINGVAMRHGEVSRGMFPWYSISAITNGVHAGTWTSPAFQELFDKHLPAWRDDNNYLRYAISIPLEEIRQTHDAAKRQLFDAIHNRTAVELDPAVMTIGFARRASTYKRADLLFTDPERLKKIAHTVGPLQLVYAGKAHPADEGGKALIRRVFGAALAVKDTIKVVYVENYDMRWGQLLTSGVDVWLNTPMRPQEASGTSGMKASLNGVPNFSVLDGWWVEGHVEGVTGWSIGTSSGSEDQAAEVATLYDKLERVILPLFYGKPNGWAEVMRMAIALNGAFFNTQRMVLQYVGNAYMPREQTATPPAPAREAAGKSSQ